jgi:hypothetical protein
MPAPFGVDICHGVHLFVGGHLSSLSMASASRRDYRALTLFFIGMHRLFLTVINISPRSNIILCNHAQAQLQISLPKAPDPYFY